MLYTQKKANNRQSEPESKDDLRKGRWKREKLTGPSIFISKAFEILQSDEHSGMVAWNEQGTNFTILDVERFEQQILPIYFRHRNFSSFVRQLNMYDFHKIRNEQNKNIFEHRQFRRNARHLLKNIRRKGCSNRKISEQDDDFAEQQPTPYQFFQEVSQKHQILRPTLATIENRSQISIKAIENPQKMKLIEDFISSLPNIVQSEQQLREIIKNMKRDSKYRCLSSKEDVKRVVQSIRRKKMKQQQDYGLDQLSIEEQIMVHNVDDRQQRDPTLTILSSDNYLPQRTNQLICSLILFEDINYTKH